jgi:hypothetical protein
VGRKKKQPSKGELQQNIANMIDHPELGALNDPFPHEFRMVEMDKGRVCVRVGDNRVVEPISVKTAVIPAVAHYLRRSSIEGPLATMDIDAISGAVKYWAASTDAIPSVQAFLWENEEPESYTWHRLPFSRTESIDDDAFPLWMEILQRIEEEGNRAAALRWIGSLFSRDPYRQQYLWLYGQGGDSKGAITRVLKRILGGSCKANLSPPPANADPERWCSKLIGVRLATFPDCNAAKFPGSGLFKQITGGDYLSGRMLFQEPVEFMPDCKVMFVSNTPPKIDDGAANARRAIICSLESFKSQWEEGDYEEELFRQAAAFCNYALTAYEESCPGGVIPCDTTNLSNFASAAFEGFEVIADRILVEDADWYILPQEFTDKVHEYRSQLGDIAGFREWLLTTKSFKKRSVRADEIDRFKLKRGTKIYPGFRLIGDISQSLTAVINIGSRHEKTRVDIDG